MARRASSSAHPVWIIVAAVLLAEGQRAKAEKILQAVLLQDPQCADAKALLGSAAALGKVR